MLPRRTFLLMASGLLLAPGVRSQATAPALMLAASYHPGLDLAAYWVSEKYDGLRAYWDGQRLWTRGGEAIAAPSWFTAGWPPTPLDGELWVGHGRFEETASTVRRQVPDDVAWQRVRFMVFDLPRHPGVFDERLLAYQAVVAALNLPWVVAVPQTRIGSHTALHARLNAVVAQGGEGLMLHRGNSVYQAVRNDDLIKLKPHEDAEARVVAHLPGKGKYEGQLGALLVETAAGARFKLGSGLTDAQRRDPPSVGTWVTYRHRGHSAKGVPRFASFLRVRADMPPAVPPPR